MPAGVSISIITQLDSLQVNVNLDVNMVGKHLTVFIFDTNKELALAIPGLL